MPKYAVIAGHNKFVPGASGHGFKEHEVARQVKDRVIHFLQQLGETVFDSTDEIGKTKTDVWRNAGNNANQVVGKDDFIIAIHLNAFNGSATGSEVFDWKGKHKALCQKISARLAKDFQWPDRGWKDGSWIGLLKMTKASVIYVEVCFIDNLSDITKLTRNIDAAAKGIVEELTGKKIDSAKKETVISTQSIDQASDWAQDDWDEMTVNGYFDGFRPHDALTREEAAVVMNRLRKNLLDRIELSQE